MRKLMCLAASLCLLTSLVSGCKHVAGKCDCCDQGNGGCTTCNHGGAVVGSPAPVIVDTVKPMPSK